MTRAALLALAAALALTGCASTGRGAAGGRWVEAEGWSPMDGGRREARERALTEAQRRAVEKGAGVRVAAATVIEDAVARRQRVRADLDGFVAAYEVRGERVEEGFLKVRIRALVRRSEAGAGRPAPPEGAGTLAIEASGPAGDGLRRGFLAAGFPAGPTKSAGFLVRARTVARPVRDRRLAGLHSSRARVVVEVVEAASGLVVATGADESAALAGEPESAEEQALEAAGAAAAAPAAAALSELLWKRL